MGINSSYHNLRSENMVARSTFLITLQFIASFGGHNEKSVTVVSWPGKCTRYQKVLNDCNWCSCNMRLEYVCTARVCSEVDMFGHFNDAIREINVGMEGHGYWRSKQDACQPGVHYRRKELLCVCSKDGTWPNPVCRDMFRVLYSVEISTDMVPFEQKCIPNKLYLIGCNVCFCPSTARIDDELCTKEPCKDDDPILNRDSEELEEEIDTDIDEELEVYAVCRADHNYKLGCKSCVCLKNNRLHCGNCTDTISSNSLESYCDNVAPGQLFSRDCNFCYCRNGYSYCSTKKCLATKRNLDFIRDPFGDTARPITQLTESSVPISAENCVPGQHYQLDCNFCHCMGGISKTIICTLKLCGRSQNTAIMHIDCVENTVYELNCLICSCYSLNGIKRQVCEVNPHCNSIGVTHVSTDLGSMHGYCEPLHFYKKDCNDCRCLTDGKTIMCTSRVCPKPETPVSIDIMPVTQTAGPCPKGLSYKIACNTCFCLSNGDAICTANNCSKGE